MRWITKPSGPYGYFMKFLQFNCPIAHRVEAALVQLTAGLTEIASDDEMGMSADRRRG
jgi:hypothetical protein